MEVVEGRAEIDDLDAFLDDLGEAGGEFDCAIQAFDPDYVVGEAHLRAAVERADRAFDRGENVARERAVEILLYAAGRRQISRALRMGVSEGESDVVVVVHSPDGDEESEAAAAAAVEDLLASASADADADAGASASGDVDASATGNADASETGDADVSATEDVDASAAGGEDSSGPAAASADESALAADRIDREAVREFFDVSEAELSATEASLADLVRERVALLDVEK